MSSPYVVPAKRSTSRNSSLPPLHERRSLVGLIKRLLGISLSRYDDTGMVISRSVEKRNHKYQILVVDDTL